MNKDHFIIDGVDQHSTDPHHDPRNPSAAGDNRLAILAVEIIRADQLFRRASLEAAQAALDAGRGLIEAKSLLKHGEWLPWLKANIPMSARSVTRYMRLARSGMTSAIVADLGIAATDEALAKHMPEETDADAAPAEPYDFGIPINAVTFVPECYPRSSFDLEYVRGLSEFLGALPPIEVNQHNELIDGRYRWEAHKACGMRRIRVTVTHTEDRQHHWMLAIKRNSRHGFRHSAADREWNAPLLAKAEEATKIDGDA